MKVRKSFDKPDEETDLDIVLKCLQQLDMEEIPQVSCPIYKKETNLAECACQCSCSSFCQEFNMFKFVTKRCFDEACSIYSPCLNCIVKINKNKTLIMILQTLTGLKDQIRYRSLKYNKMIDNSEDKFYQKKLKAAIYMYRKRVKHDKKEADQF